MKYLFGRLLSCLFASHPVRGAWIEIANRWKSSFVLMSHPVRGAWIEMVDRSRTYKIH